LSSQDRVSLGFSCSPLSHAAHQERLSPIFALMVVVFELRPQMRPPSFLASLAGAACALFYVFPFSPLPILNLFFLLLAAPGWQAKDFSYFLSMSPSPFWVLNSLPAPHGVISSSSGLLLSLSLRFLASSGGQRFFLRSSLPLSLGGQVSRFFLFLFFFFFFLFPSPSLSSTARKPRSALFPS